MAQEGVHEREEAFLNSAVYSMIAQNCILEDREQPYIFDLQKGSLSANITAALKFHGLVYGWTYVNFQNILRKIYQTSDRCYDTLQNIATTTSIRFQLIDTDKNLFFTTTGNFWGTSVIELSFDQDMAPYFYLISVHRIFESEKISPVFDEKNQVLLMKKCKEVDDSIRNVIRKYIEIDQCYVFFKEECETHVDVK